MTICLPQMFADKFDKTYLLLSQERDEFWRKQMQETENYKFVIKYVIQEFNFEKECFTQQILPTRLGFSSMDELLKQYQLTQHPHTKLVTNIRNRKFGRVEFRAV